MHVPVERLQSLCLVLDSSLYALEVPPVLAGMQRKTSDRYMERCITGHHEGIEFRFQNQEDCMTTFFVLLTTALLMRSMTRIYYSLKTFSGLWFLGSHFF